MAFSRTPARAHLQAQHQRTKVAHCNGRLSGEANKIIFAHWCEFGVVSAGCVTRGLAEGAGRRARTSFAHWQWRSWCRR